MKTESEFKICKFCFQLIDTHRDTYVTPNAESGSGVTFYHFECAAIIAENTKREIEQIFTVIPTAVSQSEFANINNIHYIKRQKLHLDGNPIAPTGTVFCCLNCGKTNRDRNRLIYLCNSNDPDHYLGYNLMWAHSIRYDSRTNRIIDGLDYDEKAN